MADDEVQEPDAAAEDDTEVAEVEDDVAEVADDTEADDEVAVDGDGGGGSRRGWVVGGAVVALVAVVGLLVVLRSGDDDDSAEPRRTTTTTAADDDEGDGATTPPSSEPPVDGEEPEPGPAGLETVDGEPWGPEDVGIGGAAHGETFVSEPIGGCDDGESRTVTYDLGGRYTRLDGTLGLADDSAPGVTVEIRFSLDGAEVYWRSFVVGEASRIQLDLTGAQQLTVTATRVFGGNTAPDACARAAQADLALT